MNNQYIRAIWVSLLATTLLACGGGGDSSESNNNGGWVTILSDSVPNTRQMNMNGKAFISKDYVACIDQASGCQPGVSVTWKNLTSGSSGTATSEYTNWTGWQHLWTAQVDLIPGPNRIEVIAADSGGRYGTASITIDGLPSEPFGVSIENGDKRISLNWQKEPNLKYKVYWSMSAADVFPHGSIANVLGLPFVHKGLTNGVKYFYVITSYTDIRESARSSIFEAVPGVPPKPENVTAKLTYSDVNLSWDPAQRADSYNVYWSNQRGVTKENGTPITFATSPQFHTGLVGLPYFYVVTASNAFGESKESEEVTVFPPLPPPTPGGLTATLRPDSSGTGYDPVIDLSWQRVPGAEEYEIFRCAKENSAIGAPSLESCVDYLTYHAQCSSSAYESIGSTAVNGYDDWNVIQVQNTQNVSYRAYRYYVIARNRFGSSPATDPVAMCSGRN